MKSQPIKNTRAVYDLKHALATAPLTKQEYIHVHAVLLKKKGCALKEVMDITGHSLVAIQVWITDYNKRGVDGIAHTQANGRSSHEADEPSKGLYQTNHY